MLVSLFKDFDVPCPFDLGRIGDFQLVHTEGPHDFYQSNVGECLSRYFFTSRISSLAVRSGTCSEKGMPMVVLGCCRAMFKKAVGNSFSFLMGWIGQSLRNGSILTPSMVKAFILARSLPEASLKPSICPISGFSTISNKNPSWSKLTRAKRLMRSWENSMASRS